MFRFVSNYNYFYFYNSCGGVFTSSSATLLPMAGGNLSLSISVPGVVNWVRVPGNVCLNKYCISVAVFLFKGVPSRPA